MKTITDILQGHSGKKERWTITNQEIWLVANGEKIKKIGQTENTYKELISEANEPKE